MPRTYLAGDTRSVNRPFLSGSLAPSRWERVGRQNGLQSTGRSGRTGFHVTDMPSANHIRGRNGVLLADACQDGMEASLGTAIADSPNLFMLVGPNTGLGPNYHAVAHLHLAVPPAYSSIRARQVRHHRGGLSHGDTEVHARDRRVGSDWGPRELGLTRPAMRPGSPCSTRRPRSFSGSAHPIQAPCGGQA